ncbi:MAG: molybdopterin molybdenumtransferase MoeA, partial [Desulfurobacteriaceae bacterium]
MGRFFISYEEALSLILDRGSNLGFEVVDLLSARGRFLAEDLCADRDWPEVPLSAMDGYAVR